MLPLAFHVETHRKNLGNTVALLTRRACLGARGLLALLLGLAGGAVGRAQAVVDAPMVAPIVLPEYHVSSERVAGLQATMDREELRQPEANLGGELMDVPGVYGHSRAADAMEPNIRGLGFDRVTTTLNGIPLCNGSPERTNSPVVLLGPVAVESLDVVKGLPSVTAGPATTGGRIELSTEPTAPEIAGASGIHGFIGTTYNGSRDGFTTEGLLAGTIGAWVGRVTFFRNDLGDFSAPNGQVVAARLDDYGASVALGWHDEAHRLQAEYLHRRLRLDETVSLPLDGKDSDADVFTLNDHWKIDAGALEKIEWRAGLGSTDPYITSESRQAPSLIFAQANTRSAGGGFTSLWRAGSDATLAAGGDLSWQERKAVRTTAAGQDYIWPDAVYQDMGVFAEWNRRLSPAWNLRLGARGDNVSSDARDADQLALGLPLRTQFALYNGPDAAKVKRDDVVGSGNALLNWTDGQGLSGFVGGGLSAQPAPVTERYRAFLNALGGDGKGNNAVELGNPALRPEFKWELATGGTWQHDWCTFNANLYYDLIDDFILRQPIGQTPATPVAPSMVVFGYRNISAELYGGEAGVTLRPWQRLTLPLTFAVSEGRNRDTGTGLSEIPPWEATAAARYQQVSPTFRFWTEVGSRIVGAKNNPAPLENPLYSATGGFALLHLRAGAMFARRLRLEAGLENLLNHEYTEYLTPPVSPFRPATGNLLPGQRVPGPGRSAWVSATLEF